MEGELVVSVEVGYDVVVKFVGKCTETRLKTHMGPRRSGAS